MKLGISVYPNSNNTQEVKEYIKTCSQNNFEKVFMHILDVTKENLEIKLNQLKEISTFAQANNMETLLDVDERIYKILGKDPSDLQFVKDLGISTLRFDTGFDGEFISKLSNNKIGVKIEINASGFVKMEEEIENAKPNYSQLSASHNFYPQEYTGLPYELWEHSCKKLRKLGYEITSFITLPRDAKTIGAWSINDGMPTLEMHRDLELDLQIRHILATNLNDCVIISSMFATQEQIEFLGSLNTKKEYFDDLKAINKIDNNKILFNVELLEDITETEKEILFFEKHIGRGDYSEYFLRSSYPRNVFINSEIMQKNSPRKFFEIGDVLIGNNEFGKYKAEILIVTKKIKYDPRKNIIGKIPKNEHFLFKYIDSWTHFKFMKGSTKWTKEHL